ncbi:MAG: SPOR domain-containing protein, partial [Vicingaceae bacterium]
GYIFGESEKEKLAEAKRREELRNELDSLRNKLKETSDQTDKNTKAIDSLGNEIQKVRTDVDGAIEELKKNPPTGTGASVTPAIPVGGGDSEFSNEYLDNKGEPLPKGFYIVVGSYSEQKWARQAKLKFINAGYAETDVLYNITNKFYNVFLSFTTSEEEARKNLRNARAEYPDAWLRKIQ